MSLTMTRDEIAQRGLALHHCRGCGEALVLLRSLTDQERDTLEDWWGSPGDQLTEHPDASALARTSWLFVAFSDEGGHRVRYDTRSCLMHAHHGSPLRAPRRAGLGGTQRRHRGYREKGERSCSGSCTY
jgi:hypothetical protein